MAQCTGHASGNPITPLRAECQGALSWILLLRHICIFHTISCHAELLPFTDCKHLLPYMSTTPLAHGNSIPSHPDYDITMTLHHQFNLLSNHCSSLANAEHVTSHQRPPFLNRQTSLNHLCDITAKATRASHEPTPVYPLPCCKAYLTCNNTPITSGELNIARWKWRNTLLHHFYTEKFQISSEVLARVHWTAHAATKTALSPPDKRFITKLTIRWLPSATRLHMCGNEISTCPLCPSEETNYHIYQCTHRIPIFLQRHTAFTAYLTSIHTPADIVTPLASGILHWATQASDAARAKSIEHATAAAQQCYHRQTQLGWNLATFGMMDTLWSTLIPDPTNQALGQKWQTKVSLWLIESAHSIWIQRNAARYKIDEVTQTNMQQLETAAQVTKIYELATKHLSQYDQQALIKESLATRLQMPEPTNRIWVTQLQRLIYLQIKRNQTRPPLPDIRQFFPVIPR